MFHAQYCNDDNDISTSPNADSDATRVRIWDENADHILTVIPDGWNGWCVMRVTESFGLGAEWWIEQPFHSIAHVLETVEDIAEGF